jgi:hypothetical protein
MHCWTPPPSPRPPLFTIINQPFTTRACVQPGADAADAVAAAALEQQRLAEETAQARAVANELLANENEQVIGQRSARAALAGLGLRLAHRPRALVATTSLSRGIALTPSAQAAFRRWDSCMIDHLEHQPPPLHDAPVPFTPLCPP